MSRVVRFATILFLWSTAINYIWEMVQMPLYKAMAWSDPYAWLLCFRASLGDGVIILFIWGVGFLIFREIHWYRSAKSFRILFLLLIGALIAIAIEIHAIGTGRWAYSDLMPRLPGPEVGLSPLIQLLILPWSSMILTRLTLSNQSL